MNVNYKDSKKRANGAIVTLSIGLAVNVVLFVTKLFVGLACNSISILSDAINNLGDTFACSIGIISFVLLKKRSENLSFGYGRMEYVADFLMAIIVCCVGGGFLYTAIERMILAYLLAFSWIYFAIIAVTALIKIGLGFFYLIRNKKTNSGVLKASAIDSFTDAGITAMTLMGYGLNRYAKLRIDAIFGIAISVFMLINGIKLLVDSIRILLGEKMKENEVEGIKEICEKQPSVKEVKDMNLHKYGEEYEELVIDAVFTKDENYDTILHTVDEMSKEIKEKYGYFPKICITGGNNGKEERRKQEDQKA